MPIEQASGLVNNICQLPLWNQGYCSLNIIVNKLNSSNTIVILNIEHQILKQLLLGHYLDFRPLLLFWFQLHRKSVNSAIDPSFILELPSGKHFFQMISHQSTNEANIFIQGIHGGLSSDGNICRSYR